MKEPGNPTDDDRKGDPDDRLVVQRWYASSFDVGHSAFEFKVDCGQDSPDGTMMTVYLRVIASPFNTRALFRLLGMQLLRYADRFGTIDDNGGDGAMRGDA